MMTHITILGLLIFELCNARHQVGLLLIQTVVTTKTVSAGLTVGGCGSSSCSGYGVAVALAMVLAMVMSVALMVFQLN